MYLLNRIRRYWTETSWFSQKACVTSTVPLLALFLLLAFPTTGFGQANSTVPGAQSQTPPKTWIDEETGHRVTRLTDEPNSEALSSGRNAFTPDGLDMIYVSPRGIHVLNLATLKTRLLVSGRTDSVIVGTKTRRVFFVSGGVYVRVVDIDTGQEKVVIKTEYPLIGDFLSVNADETLLVGTRVKPGSPEFSRFEHKAHNEAYQAFKANHANGQSNDEIEQKAKQMRLDAHIPEEMITFNLQTGEVRTILKGTDWLNKVQFSPTDPNLILYRHEAPYANTEVDRIWTIRADGTQNQMLHQRAIPGEIATHAFWSRDGKTIWYELQRPIPNQPASADHYLVGYDLATGKRRYFHMDDLEYSIHYDASGDGTLFCGSGQQSKPTHGVKTVDSQLIRNGEWIELLHPNLNTSGPGTSTQDAISFRRERLTNIFNNRDFTISSRFASEVRFSPDNRLVIFTSDMLGKYGSGPTYIFAVEVN